MAPASSAAVGVEPIPELLRLGEELAQARQRAGLSAEDLARRLRVEPRLLQALEVGDHSQLPEGVFIVALARRIAGALNAQVEDAISNVRQSRLMEHKPPGRSTPSEEPTPALTRRPPQAPPPASRSPRRPPTHRPSSAQPWPWRWPLAALLAAAGASAAWLILQQSSGRGPSSATTLAPPPAPMTPAAKAPGGGGPTPSPASPSPNQPSRPPASPDDSNSLLLLASEPSWVEVRDTEGRTIFEGTLSGEKRFPIGKGLEVIAGRPYAVRAALGSTPPTPLGGVDDIRWKRFSPPALTPKAPAASPPSP